MPGWRAVTSSLAHNTPRDPRLTNFFIYLLRYEYHKTHTKVQHGKKEDRVASLILPYHPSVFQTLFTNTKYFFKQFYSGITIVLYYIKRLYIDYCGISTLLLVRERMKILFSITTANIFFAVLASASLVAALPKTGLISREEEFDTVDVTRRRVRFEQAPILPRITH